MQNDVYAVAYLLRKTSITLTEIRGLSIGQFRDLFEEIAFQDSVSEYQTASYVANILAAIANTIPSTANRTYKAADFLGTKEPRRTKVETDAKVEIEAIAKRFNIKLPSKEIKEL